MSKESTSLEILQTSKLRYSIKKKHVSSAAILVHCVMAVKRETMVFLINEEEKQTKKEIKAVLETGQVFI